MPAAPPRDNSGEVAAGLGAVFDGLYVYWYRRPGYSPVGSPGQVVEDEQGVVLELWIAEYGYFRYHRHYFSSVLRAHHACTLATGTDRGQNGRHACMAEMRGVERAVGVMRKTYL